MQMRKWLLLVSASLFACQQPATAGSSVSENAIKMYNSKNYQAARKLFEGTPSTQSDANALYYYALTLHALGEADLARATFSRILTKFPASGAATYARQALGLPAPAKSIVSKVIATPQDAPAKTDQPAGAIPFTGTEQVPIYPAATDIKHTSPTATVPVDSWAFSVSGATIDQISMYYRKYLNDHGWRWQAVGNEKSIRLDGFHFSKADGWLVFELIEDPDKKNTVIVVVGVHHHQWPNA
jgi:hypothetical protein